MREPLTPRPPLPSPPPDRERGRKTHEIDDSAVRREDPALGRGDAAHGRSDSALGRSDSARGLDVSARGRDEPADGRGVSARGRNDSALGRNDSAGGRGDAAGRRRPSPGRGESDGRGVGGEARLLVLSTVYPNAAQPHHGVFVRERMRGLPPGVAVTVVAPAPWFPFVSGLRPGFRPVMPREEMQDGVRVLHPRFLSFPGLFKCLDGLLLALGILPALLRLRRTFRFDAIDAHFVYPEGVAAALAGRLLGVPVLITLRGMLPLLMPFRLRRPQLRWALRQADRVIAVAAPLKDDAAALGIPPQKVRVIENGIDADLFRPLDRGEARRALGLLDRVAVSSPLGGGGLEQGGGQEGGGTDGHNPPAPKVLPGCGAPLLTSPLPQPPPSQGGGTSTALAKAPILLSVGTLAPRKGFHLVIEALPALAERFPEIRFAIVGGAGAEGAMERELRDLAARLGVGERVIFAGPQKRGDLAAWYSAADLSVLASAHEGCPNVVLESLACGTPVVATPVGSLPEILKDADAGLLVERTVPALTAGIAAALARSWDRDRVRARVAARTWQAVGREVLEEVQAALGRRTCSPSPGRGECVWERGLGGEGTGAVQEALP